MIPNKDREQLFKTACNRKWPFYVDLLPPCNNACPAGENIQLWLTLANAGKFREAWDVITQQNPLPAIHGRVCYHPCEANCNRRGLDEEVSIHAVERFLGDLAIQEGWGFSAVSAANADLNQAAATKVLVVGAGPAGLSAAYHLRIFGYDVTVCDAMEKAGGMMRVGIPSYRLPRGVMDGEIKRIENLGVKFVFNHRVTDVLAEKKQGGFAAVFLAVGAQRGRKIDVPAKDACPIVDAISFLRSTGTENEPDLNGKRVAVYGGGNTAIDVARVAKRLGASEVTVIYHRDRQRMTAFDIEVEEALEEGINFNLLRMLQGVEGNNITLEVVELDEKGGAQNTGVKTQHPADLLVLAIGQITETEFLKDVSGLEFKSDGTVAIDEHMMTGHAGMFAGGDMVPFERSVTIAVGHGKKAARNIDAYLRNTTYVKPPKHPLVSYDMMNLWFLEGVDKIRQNAVDPEVRIKSFVEVIEGLAPGQALYESQRCLSCGNCFECDGCYAACPERAIVKLGPGKRYLIDRKLCTGCGVCEAQCPCAAIEMHTNSDVEVVCEQKEGEKQI